MAIFHARDRMDEAVRVLEERVGPEHVHAEPDPAPRVEPAPRSLFGLPFSVHYGGTGAGIGMLVGLAASGAPGGTSTMSTIWLVLVFTALGGLFGTFVGVSVGAFRRARWEDRTTAHRFVLRVDVDTPAERDTVEQTIASYGGELAPA